MVIITALLGAD